MAHGRDRPHASTHLFSYGCTCLICNPIIWLRSCKSKTPWDMVKQRCETWSNRGVRNGQTEVWCLIEDACICIPRTYPYICILSCALNCNIPACTEVFDLDALPAKKKSVCRPRSSINNTWEQIRQLSCIRGVDACDIRMRAYIFQFSTAHAYTNYGKAHSFNMSRPEHTWTLRLFKYLGMSVCCASLSSRAPTIS